MTDPTPGSSGSARLTTTGNALLKCLETRSNGPKALDFRIATSEEGSHTGWGSQKMVVPVNRSTGKDVTDLERNIMVATDVEAVQNEAYVLVPDESGQYKCYAALLSQWGPAASGDGTMPYYKEGTKYRGVLTLDTLGGRAFPMVIDPSSVKGQSLAVGTALTNLRRHAGVKADTVSEVDVLRVETNLETTQTVLTLAYCSDSDVSRLNDSRMPDDHEKILDQHLHLVPVGDLGDTIESVRSKGFRITLELDIMATRMAEIPKYCDAINSTESAMSGNTEEVDYMATDYELVQGLIAVWRDKTGWEGPKALTGDEDF